MPFSLGSYLLGVGTVVGALAFGFGGGVLMTNTAMKQTAAGPTRVERVARSEPEPAAPPQAASASENPVPPVEPAPAARPDPVPAAQAEAPKPETKPEARREAETAKPPEPTRQSEPVNQMQPNQAASNQAGPNQIGSNQIAPNQIGQREAEQKKAAERKIERQKRYAERKTRAVVVDRTRPRQFDETEEPERDGFAFRREEPRFDLFRTLRPQPSNRSIDIVPVDGDD
jgi:DNA polymerase III gamma/tau subunit